MARIVFSCDALKLVVRLLDAPVQFIPFPTTTTCPWAAWVSRSGAVHPG